MSWRIRWTISSQDDRPSPDSRLLLRPIATSERARMTLPCCNGSACGWLWRDCRGAACHRHRGPHDRTWPERPGWRARGRPDRVRRAGGDCQPLMVTDPHLLANLLALVEPVEPGDPMSALRWTCKSLRQLATELTARGHRISRTVSAHCSSDRSSAFRATARPVNEAIIPTETRSSSTSSRGIADRVVSRLPTRSDQNAQEGRKYGLTWRAPRRRLKVATMTEAFDDLAATFWSDQIHHRNTSAHHGRIHHYFLASKMHARLMPRLQIFMSALNDTNVLSDQWGSSHQTTIHTGASIGIVRQPTCRT